MTSLAIGIITLSILLQAMAAIQALRLIRVTGWRMAWVAIAVALLLMAGRRVVSLLDMVISHRPLDPAPEGMALLISVLMVIGMWRVGTLFAEWAQARMREDVLRRAHEAFIRSHDPDRLDVFRMLAADLAHHCGWAGVTIGLADEGDLPVALASAGDDIGPAATAAAWQAVLREAALGRRSGWIEMDHQGRPAIVYPLLAGSDTVGLIVAVGRRTGWRCRHLANIGSMIFAIGGMVGAVRYQSQRLRADQEQKLLILELEHSNKELEQFAFISSHDLQEPLRMIVLYLELLKRRYGSRLDAEGIEFLGFAVEGARRLQTMILDLLDYCRLGHRGESQPVCDAQSALDLALRQLGTQESAISVLTPMPMVAAPGGDLSRIFLNLIGNALKFSAPDRPPEITVRADRDGAWWTFQVADNGIGIDPAYYDKIFQLFQRLHPRNERGGTGIGLAFVKKAVECWGGRVWVESVVGRGSIFRFTIPAVTAA